MKLYVHITRACTFILILGLVFPLFSHAEVSYAESKSVKKVLFISSYSASFGAVPLQIDGIQSVFDDQNIIFDIEYMDTKRFYTEENYENFFASMKYKLNQLEPYDVIIVGDDNALQFALDNQEQLFNNIPIIFLGINSIDRATLANDNTYISGVMEAVSISETIDLASKIYPNAKEVLAIIDNTVTGHAALESYYNVAPEKKALDFKVINSEDYSFDSFKNEIAKVKEDTIVLYLSMLRDKEGTVISLRESAKILEEYCNVPVFSVYSTVTSYGLIGGKVVSYFEQGRSAANMVVDVLNGTPIENMTMISESPNQYMFNYNMIQKFDIDEKLLPQDSILLNKEVSFYQQYKEMIFTVLFIALVLLSIIFFLVANIVKRKKIENKLIQSNEEITAVYEELTATEEELRQKYNELQFSREQLIKSKARYKLVFKASFEGLWDYNFETKETYMSGEWHDKFIDKKTMEAWYSIIHPEDYIQYLEVLQQIKNGEKDRYSYEYRIKNDNNDYIWIHERGIATYDDKGLIKRLVGSHMDVTVKKRQEQKIIELAFYDMLTRLPNRVALQDKLQNTLEQARKNGTKGAIIFLDVDNFKFINDTYGHTTGDEVLKEIGHRLRTLRLRNIFIGRLGGDEFVVVANDIDDINKVALMAETVQNIFETPFVINHKEFHLTTSTGVALYPANGMEIEELLKNADTAMYKAKATGKNRYMFFNKVMNDEIYDRMIVQNSIRYALDNKEFVLYFQPIIDIESRKLVGYEALIRWMSKEHGFIPPNRFIKVAEEMGIIVPIGNWVFETACKFAKTINENRQDKYVVSVNVSSVQLIRNDFVDTIKDIINEVDVNPELVGIEITETALMESFEQNALKIKSLQKLGIHISLDDFGTGYSSLNYLRQLPIDTLKIDKTFIDDLANMNNKKNLTEDIIMIAHKIGISVVAEGVETEKQYKILHDYRCDIVQGYLISKPLPEDEAIDFMYG